MGKCYALLKASLQRLTKTENKHFGSSKSYDTTPPLTETFICLQRGYSIRYYNFQHDPTSLSGVGYGVTFELVSFAPGGLRFDNHCLPLLF
jgi:hypothetical protein